MSSGEVTFSTEAATQLERSAAVLLEAVDEWSRMASELKQVSGCGLFPSGAAIQTGLQSLGAIALEAITRLRSALDKISDAIRNAGNLTEHQESANASAVRNPKPAGTSNSADPSGIMTGGAPSSSSGTTAAPGIGTLLNGLVNGTVHQQANPLGVSGGLPGLMAAPPQNPQSLGPASAGTFPTGASPEPAGALSLDAIVSALSTAESSKLVMLAQQWQQVAESLSTAIAGFNGVFMNLLEGPDWSGEAASQMKQSLSGFTQEVQNIADQSHANSGSITAWAGGLGATKGTITTLAGNRDIALAAAPPETKLQVQQSFDTIARMEMGTTYNPAVTAISGGLSNISDPNSPVGAQPLFLPGMGPNTGGSGPTFAAAPFSGGGGSGGAASGGSSGGGGGGGGGGSDVAAALQRRATADAASAAKAGGAGANTPPAGGPSQSGSGSPAAAAQSAASKAGDAGQGLTRGGLGTKSSGLGSLSSAEKSAAEQAKRAAAQAAAKAAGGGGAGGGGSAGGASLAAAEKQALSARGASAMSAAERAMAAEQGALSNSRATPAAAGGTPMGGARPGGGGDDGKSHKSARYLRSTENGEEIVGDHDDVAPTVIGGLNLDTSDSPPAPRSR